MSSNLSDCFAACGDLWMQLYSVGFTRSRLRAHFRTVHKMSAKTIGELPMGEVERLLRKDVTNKNL